jgi:hypothetical protein
MKYKCEVIVNKPKELVVELYRNPQFFKEWQDGFIDMTLPDKTDKKINYHAIYQYKVMGNKIINLEERILNDLLPDSFEATYSTDDMANSMKSTFIKSSPTSTKLIAELEYYYFEGILPKMMSIFMKWSFKKQTQKWLNQFKTFAESES